MNTYEENHAKLVEHLINTYDLYLDEPEHLRQPADLKRFLETHNLKSETAINQTMVEQVHRLREDLRLCWTAKTLAEMITWLNTFLTLAAVTVQVEADAENRVNFQFQAQSSTPFLQNLALECAVGIVFVLQNYGIERMRACAAEPCRDVFVDVSRNKTRRFCSERCANRYNIAAFRDRQKHNEN